MYANRRDFLILLASLAAVSALTLYDTNASEAPSWVPEDVDWDAVINDVINKRNALISGIGDGSELYQVGTPHWCMEKALDQKFCI